MKHLFLVTASIFLTLDAEEKPNILWLTSEDNSAHWIGAYGNQNAHTPNIDKLAEKGLRYNHAYSNAPVCAVARCTLIMGRYASSLGTQNMRSRYPVPKQLKSYAQLLDKAGYQTSNPGKTDYNIQGNDRLHWNSKKRKKGEHPWQQEKLKKPFFHVINFDSCHESCLFNSKNGGNPPAPKRVKPDQVHLPPFLPDTPELRSDWASYHDKVSLMDHQVGQIIQSLKKSKHADNTIIFYYSDHGGVLPRSKRFIYRTGTRVPLVIYLPKKWQHLSPHKPGSSVDDVVAFVDFGPTVLEIAGATVQPDMQGQPFLGKNKKSKDYAFLIAQRFDEQVFKCVRGLTNGKFRYVKNFYPHRHRGIESGYPYGQAGWRSYKRFIDSKKGTQVQNYIWREKQPAEEFYSPPKDPWEVDNLIERQEHQELIATMRKALREKMISTKDSGILPEMFYQKISTDSTVYDYIRSPEFPYEEVLAAAWPTESDKQTKQRFSHPHAAVRYWAAIQCSINPLIAKNCLIELKKSTLDESLPVRFAAAEALSLNGHTKLANDTIQSLLDTTQNDIVSIQCLKLAKQTGLADTIGDKKWNKYCSRGSYGARLKRGVKKPEHP